jgi:hypothetical protein
MFLTGCNQRQSANQHKILTMFKLSDKDSIFRLDSIINKKDFSYNTLLELTNYQKSLSIGKILSDTYPPYAAYLVGIQERLPHVFTVIIYIDTDDIAPMYLINYKDTVLVDYIYHDGSYVYYTEGKTDEKEIIYSYDRWFEFHHDTVYKIENNVRDNYYSKTGKQVLFGKDSIITKDKIEEDGRFREIRDNIICHPFTESSNHGSRQGNY